MHKRLLSWSAYFDLVNGAAAKIVAAGPVDRTLHLYFAANSSLSFAPTRSAALSTAGYRDTTGGRDANLLGLRLPRGNELWAAAFNANTAVAVVATDLPEGA